MKIGIIVAMQDELACVEGMLENKTTATAESGSQFIMGHAGRHEIILTQSGIGKVNAAIRTFELIDKYHPDIVINSGVAGGIDKETRVMDMVVGTDVVYHDVWCGEGNEYGQVQGLPDRFAGNKELVEKVLNANQGKRVYGGLICSGDKFITDRSELNEIKGKFADGLAVDMESGAIAQVCHIYGVPFISFRIISDTPGAEAHWQQYENFWQTMADRSFGVVRTFLESLPTTL